MRFVFIASTHISIRTFPLSYICTININWLQQYYIVHSNKLCNPPFVCKRTFLTKCGWFGECCFALAPTLSPYILCIMECIRNLYHRHHITTPSSSYWRVSCAVITLEYNACKKGRLFWRTGSKEGSPRKYIFSSLSPRNIPVKSIIFRKNQNFIKEQTRNGYIKDRFRGPTNNNFVLEYFYL